MVTADVPSGSIRPVSRARPARRPPAMAMRRADPDARRRWRRPPARSATDRRTAASGSRRRPPPGPGPAEGPVPVEAVAGRAWRTSAPPGEPSGAPIEQRRTPPGWRPARSQPTPRGRWRTSAAARRRKALRPPLLRPRPPPQQHSEEGELEEGERAGRGQVERLGREPVDLHLERRVPGAAEQQHDAERREREQERDRRGGGDGRPEQRERDLPQGPPSRGAEHAGGVLQPRVEVGPQRSPPCAPRRRS